MENQIIIKPTFDAKSIFWASITVGLGSRFIIFFIAFFSIITLNILLSGANHFDSWMPFLIMMVIMPVLVFWGTYRRSKKAFNDNPKLKEDITYTLNNEYFFEKAETYEVKYFWKEVFKIQEKKDFFLIYIRKNVAKIIKKSDLKDNQYNELKTLFNSLPIKKSLK
jgi:hypothetical protein